MPIARPSAPLSTTAALFDGLPAFLAGPDYGSKRKVIKRISAGPAFQIPTAAELGFPTDGSTPTTIPDFSPIHVFGLGAADVMKGLGAAAAVSAGWRFFVGHPAQQIVLGWVSQQPNTGMWKVAATFYGSGVAAALNQSNSLLPLVSNTANYELRMLTMPSLNLEAFHLKALDPGWDDVFAPYPNLSAQLLPGLNTQPSYTESDFFAAIRRAIPLRKYRLPRSGG